MKPWWKSRTIIIARVMMVVSIVQQFALQIIPGDYVGYVLFGMALLMEVLRWVTTDGIGAADDDFTGGEV